MAKLQSWAITLTESNYSNYLGILSWIWLSISCAVLWVLIGDLVLSVWGSIELLQIPADCVNLKNSDIRKRGYLSFSLQILYVLVSISNVIYTALNIFIFIFIYKSLRIMLIIYYVLMQVNTLMNHSSLYVISDRVMARQVIIIYAVLILLYLFWHKIKRRKNRFCDIETGV